MAIDSVMKMEKKNYPQVFFRRMQIQNKRKTMTSKFINTELKLDSASEFSDTELESKLKSDFDSYSE